MIRKFLGYFLGITLLLTSCGCAKTTLRPLPIDYGESKLNSLANRTLSLKLPADSGGIVGHQWTLVIIPAGNITIDSINQVFLRGLKRGGLLRGVRLEVLTAQTSPELAVNSISTKCSVGDLLIIRRISCNIEVDLSTQGVQSIIYGEATRYRFSGHRDLIEPVLYEAIEGAAERIYRTLGL